MNEDIRYEVAGPVATVTFDRPEVRNAFTRQMFLDLTGLVRRADADREVRCIVLQPNRTGAPAAC